MGLGGAIAAWVLGFSGYVENAPDQTAKALNAIRFNYAVVPIAACIILAALMLFYKVDMVKILKDLEDRRHTK